MTTESIVAHNAAGTAPQNVSSAKKKYLSVAQGVALIYGTNIGAGVLSLPYAARNGGFLALVVAQRGDDSDTGDDDASHDPCASPATNRPTRMSPTS